MAEQTRRGWWKGGVLFGILAGVLWVPVQLTQPPAPDLPSSLLIGAILAAIGAVLFGGFLPFPPKREPPIWLILIGTGLAFLTSGGVVYLVTRDPGLALRIGLPRTLYVLALGLLLLWLIRRHQVDRASPRA